jgi:hypothetical protein
MPTKVDFQPIERQWLKRSFGAWQLRKADVARGRAAGMSIE